MNSTVNIKVLFCVSTNSSIVIDIGMQSNRKASPPIKTIANEPDRGPFPTMTYNLRKKFMKEEK